MSEYQTFIQMLNRTKVGYGMRHEWPGMSVLVEHVKDDKTFYITDWTFDEDGNLKSINHYPGEEN